MTSPIKKIKVGSRASALAIKQVSILHEILDEQGIKMDFDLTAMPTMGDKDKSKSLISNDADNFFTDSLDKAVAEGCIDIAIHSAKDLPQKLNKKLSIYALTASLDSTDAFVGRASFYKLKKGAKVGTSSLIRRDQAIKLNANIETIDIRGTIEERIDLIDQGVCDGIIVATIALKRLGLESKILDIMPWEGAPLQGQIAVIGRSNNAELSAIFSKIDARNKYGAVSLVGAGPGDPELITIKGIKALEHSQCVFYDYLAHKDLLNYARQAEQIYVGKRKGDHAMSQDELSALVRLKAMEGKNVVRLKGGDPLIFGRGAEEIEHLRSYHIDVHVIPGVSSATAIPTSAGIPLTARDKSSSVAFVSGHGKGEKIDNPKPIEVPNVDTLVFLMGLTKIHEIVNSLKHAGWAEDTPMIVISRGTCVDEKMVAGTVVTIEDKVMSANLKPPALIIAGQTVDFWNRYANRQKKILYTGTDPVQAEGLGVVVHLPMIDIRRKEITKEEQRALISRMNQYEMIIFTSRFAVEYFFELMLENGFGKERLSSIDLIAIGQSTQSALRRNGAEAALVPEIETGDGLLAALRKNYSLTGKKILFPRSSLPNPNLKSELSRLGAIVDEITVYNNTRFPKRNLPTESIDRIVFTSPSTVRNFLDDYAKIPDQWEILSKGPVTQKFLKEAGYESRVIIHGQI